MRVRCVVRMDDDRRIDDDERPRRVAAAAAAALSPSLTWHLSLSISLSTPIYTHQFQFTSQPSRGALVISASQFVSLGESLCAGWKKMREEDDVGVVEENETAASEAAEKRQPPRLSVSLSLSLFPSLSTPRAGRKRASCSSQLEDCTRPSSLSQSLFRTPNSKQQPTGPRQKVGVDAADGKRQASLQVGARQDGGHRAGDCWFRQGQSRRDLESAAQDGAGRGRGRQRQGKEREEVEKFSPPFFFNPCLCFFFS